MTEPCSRLHWDKSRSGPTRLIGDKNGSKRHLLVDGRGVPLSFVVTGANRLVDPISGSEQLFLLPNDAEGIEVQQIQGLDRSRPIYCVKLHEVDCNDAVHIATADHHLTQHLGVIAAAGLSAEMLAGTSRVHELACNYAKEREQFGQPIGRFQAIKHLLADGKVLLEGRESILYAALWHPP